MYVCMYDVCLYIYIYIYIHTHTCIYGRQIHQEQGMQGPDPVVRKRVYRFNRIQDDLNRTLKIPIATYGMYECMHIDVCMYVCIICMYMCVYIHT